MIAPPPGWGGRAPRAWYVGIGAYLLSLLAGAVVVGSLLHLLANAVGRLPVQVTALVAVASVVLGARVGARLPGSRWRVPQGWARFGHTAYAAMFGGALGTGVLTATPSIGFYALVAWGLSGPSWYAVVPVFGAFGMARGLPLLTAAIGARRRGEYPHEELDSVVKFANNVAYPLELTLLAATGTLLLVASGPSG